MYIILVYAEVVCGNVCMATLHPERYRQLLAQLRLARAEAGLTQVAAAQALGVTQQFLSRVELGERRIDPVELETFAKAYGKDILFFFEEGGEGT